MSQGGTLWIGTGSRGFNSCIHVVSDDTMSPKTKCRRIRALYRGVSGGARQVDGVVVIVIQVFKMARDLQKLGSKRGYRRHLSELPSVFLLIFSLKHLFRIRTNSSSFVNEGKS